MSNKSYHHGDLRTMMIEKGLELINKGGVGALSLRKVAATCGVSHAAPYSHFKSKDELVEAIGNHVAGRFANALKVAAGEPSIDGLVNLGWAYVLFFAENPQYYDFVFVNGDVIVGDVPYEPYDLYKEYMKQLMENIGHPQEAQRNTFIAQWALIHGLTALAVMESPQQPHTWEVRVREILTKNYIITTGGY